MVDIIFASLFFVILPMMSVGCACSYEISKERTPKWIRSLWGPFLSMGFFVLFDILIAEHHPHIPQFLVLLTLTPILGLLMLLPSLAVVLIRRKFARPKTSKQETQQSLDSVT